eukprot:TRINITY_DN56040_c0_g1_i1.p1 TRINITY_DN56040_c0_g1~~TRINITY_DN56040_c0_g1_i1.p1  ORF type:complete len:357 (+),score=104.89 TRINITY_DN56040_c0_g1_i1:73-1071(+)
MRAHCAALSAALLLQAAAGQAPPTPGAKCAGPCKSDAECHGLSGCPLCLPFNQTGALQCGANCGGACNTDDDCPFKSPVTGCPFCYQGVCAKTNPNNTCGSSCQTDQDCAPAPADPDCKQCHPTGVPGKFVCGVGCGRKCTSDAQCDAKGWCSECGGDGVPNVCGHGKGRLSKVPAPAPPPTPSRGVCAGPCKTHTDCDSNKTCPLCLPFNATGALQCGDICGGACATDADCPFKDPVTGCPHCYQGVCSKTDPKATCGSPCQTDQNCAPAPADPDCKLCNPTGAPDGSKVCGAGCGRKCKSDSDCLAKAYCPACGGGGIPGVCGHKNASRA